MSSEQLLLPLRCAIARRELHLIRELHKMPEARNRGLRNASADGRAAIREVLEDTRAQQTAKRAVAAKPQHRATQKLHTGHHASGQSQNRAVAAANPKKTKCIQYL